MSRKETTVAVIDYGLGNLFSIRNACEAVGLEAHVTSDKHVIERADGIILPGVGAFGEAMKAVERLDLAGVLREKARSNTPFLGICLGLQLLFSESEEFGRYKGLDVIPGVVKRLRPNLWRGRRLKVPHVGWNSLLKPQAKQWSQTLLRDIAEGAFMYFVHSYCVVPESQSVVLCNTLYGEESFCSGVHKGVLRGLQFHPERSGRHGLSIYRAFAGDVWDAGQAKQ